jgi:hypothetical protein
MPFANPDLFFQTLILMLFLHFLADFPLQGDFLANAKDPSKNSPFVSVPSMFAHSSIHAGMTYILTGDTYIMFVMLLGHFMIDTFKCRGLLGVGPRAFAHDQLLHVALIVALAMRYCGYTLPSLF